MPIKKYTIADIRNYTQVANMHNLVVMYIDDEKVAGEVRICIDRVSSLDFRKFSDTLELDINVEGHVYYFTGPLCHQLLNLIDC